MGKLTMGTSTEVCGVKVPLKQPLDDSYKVPAGRETVVHMKQKTFCSRRCVGIVIAVFIILAIGGTLGGMYLRHHRHRRQCIDWGAGCEMEEPPKFEHHHGHHSDDYNDVDMGSKSGKSGSKSGDDDDDTKSGEGGSGDVDSQESGSKSGDGDHDSKSGERGRESGGSHSKSGEGETRSGESRDIDGPNEEGHHGVFPGDEAGDWMGDGQAGSARRRDRHRYHSRKDSIEPRHRPRYRKYPPGPAGPQDARDRHVRPKHHLPLP